MSNEHGGKDTVEPVTAQRSESPSSIGGIIFGDNFT